MVLSIKNLLIYSVLFLQSSVALSQSVDWNIVDGQAVSEKRLGIRGKTQAELYKEVYRWLADIYTNPEDILKVKIENEYFRGLGYQANCIKTSSISTSDLRYTFSIEIKNEEVIFRFFQAFIEYTYSEDNDEFYPAENFIHKNPVKVSRQKNKTSETVQASLNEFSKSMFDSLENHLTKTMN